ncbi:MAG: hypothetical protein ACRD02_09005 [Acidimicrobiia bacterium]
MTSHGEDTPEAEEHLNEETEEELEPDFEEDFDEEALALDEEDLTLVEGEALEEQEEKQEEEQEEEEEEEEEEEPEEALDELEAEELDMLTEDEEVEVLLVDEAAELRALRREEMLSLDVEAEEIRRNEFVCSSCFLVKRTSQLANRKRMICRDCAA